MSDADIIEIKMRLAELERRVAGIEGAPAPPEPSGDPEVLRLLGEGNLIGAIKRYRELTGAGLAEAKDAVERLRGF
jgi:ribosomal protein L7/L12